MTATTTEVLSFKLKERIAAPIADVYRAIVDPEISSRYFMTSASGPIETGSVLEWSWPNGERSQVRVEEVLPEQRIVFHWVAQGVRYQTRVTMTLIPTAEGAMLEISEGGWHNDEAGRTSSYDHCAGWQHMLLSLKGYLVHSIELRR